jgi:hypothetical protein
MYIIVKRLSFHPRSSQMAGRKKNGKYREICFCCRDNLAKIFSSALTRMGSTSGQFISHSISIRETLGKRSMVTECVRKVTEKTYVRQPRYINVSNHNFDVFG